MDQILNADIEFVDSERVDMCSSNNCKTEIQRLKQEIQECNEQIQSSTKLYHSILILNLKKDLIIRELKSNAMDTRFGKFHDLFPAAVIEELKTVPDAPEKDSMFVLKAVKGLYGNDLSRLKNRTYSGRKKEPLTPEKVDTLNKLYMKRIDHAEKNKANIAIRKSHFGKLVKMAIETINRYKNMETPEVSH